MYQFNSTISCADYIIIQLDKIIRLFFTSSALKCVNFHISDLSVSKLPLDLL